MNPRLKQLTEILHTIFCHRLHEDNMFLYDTTDKCCYYLEQTIEDTWNQPAHLIWIEQATVFMQLSEDGLGMLEHIVSIYKAAEALRKANPLYMKYVGLLINHNKGEER